MSTKPKSTIGDYEILKTIGFGGFGVVKLVKSKSDGGQYAMKVFEMDDTERERTIRQTQDEYDKVKDLSMSYIPKYYDFKVDEVWTRRSGNKRVVSYLLMENCQGLEIFEFIQKVNGINDERILRYVFKEIVKALHQLHKNGVAHRDIKLENVMVTSNYEFKLIDLGMCVPLAGKKKDGFNRACKGTPAYMSPEHWQREAYQGHDADLFALGVSLFVMRMYKYPFESSTTKKTPGGERADMKYLLLQSAHPEQFWDEFKDVDSPPSDDFKDFIEVMLQENPKARLTMVDLMGHPWMQGPTATKAEFKSEYESIISDMSNYPSYSVDFDRNQAKEALRGDDGEEDDFDYLDAFKFDKWASVEMNEFNPETAGRHRCNINHEKPTEIWELVCRLAKKNGGMQPVTMIENSWKISFNPKDTQKKEEAKASTGETGGGDPVEDEEEEEKKDEADAEPADLTESVLV